MGANIAGIYGAQIFREDDKPRYRRAFAIACAVLAVGLVLAIIRYLDDHIRRRRKARHLADVSSTDTSRERVPPAKPAEDQPIPVIGRRPSI
jgi:hypothetical protein